MKLVHWLLAIAFFATASPVHAYLDPGTGSMLLQVMLGGLAAVGVVLKLYWHKLRVALGLRRKPAAEDEPT